jgi:hypothetical protein
VWAGAGSPRHVVGLSPAELARLTRARTVDVVQDDPYHFAGEPRGDSEPDSAGELRDPDDPKER